MGGGTREDIITLTIPEGLDFMPYLKQSVSVPIGFLSPAKGSIVYFIPKGSQIIPKPSEPHLEPFPIKSPLGVNPAVKSPFAA